MSMATCYDCDRVFDTDDDPDCIVEIGNMRKLHKEIFLCESCRDNRQTASDGYDYNEQRGRDRERDQQ